MRYANVCLEAFGYTLPQQVVTSDEIESRLAPLYERLRLPAGRLELMTGIRERRFWPVEQRPGEISVQSAAAALRNAGLATDKIGALIHASVSRDYVEPATACAVHHDLDLPRECVIYDVSNACLGMLNGMLQIANMIELGQIEAGIVVGTENGSPLVENTIARLNTDPAITRETVKMAMASLTIGSASVAAVLVNRRLSNTGNRLIAAAVRANTQHHQLCHSGRSEALDTGLMPLMHTDSEQLLHAGCATGAETFAAFMQQAKWTRAEIQKSFCHQVGVAHRRLMFKSLELDPVIDFSTVEFLGNTGAAALPITMALGIEQNRLQAGDHVALLGIGSGVNSVMIGVDWQHALVQPATPAPHADFSQSPIASLRV